MNVFAIYPCPIKSARALDDARVVKMATESAQILCTVAHERGFAAPLRATHAHHPVVLWAGAGRGNWDWLYEHMLALDEERLRRYGDGRAPNQAVQKCRSSLLPSRRSLASIRTPHVNCARNCSLGIDFTHIEDTHLAYRMYLAARWPNDKRPAVCTVKSLLGVNR